MIEGRTLWLDQVGYEEAWALQRRLHAQRVAQEVPDTLILLEHTPVYTIGSTGKATSFLTSAQALREAGSSVVAVDRGGDVTWHGPGQLVGYPIFDLARRHRDLHRLLREVEQALIDACARLGVLAERREGATGVWVGDQKLASIGMRVSRWVSMHGFALNVDPDLAAFDAIVPCGIQGCRMTSLARLVGCPLGIEDLIAPVIAAMEEVFEIRLPIQPRSGRAELPVEPRSDVAGGEPTLAVVS